MALSLYKKHNNIFCNENIHICRSEMIPCLEIGDTIHYIVDKRDLILFEALIDFLDKDCIKMIQMFLKQPKPLSELNTILYDEGECLCIRKELMKKIILNKPINISSAWNECLIVFDMRYGKSNICSIFPIIITEVGFKLVCVFKKFNRVQQITNIDKCIDNLPKKIETMGFRILKTLGQFNYQKVVSVDFCDHQIILKENNKVSGVIIIDVDDSEESFKSVCDVCSIMTYDIILFYVFSLSIIKDMNYKKTALYLYDKILKYKNSRQMKYSLEHLFDEEGEVMLSEFR
jgi:hypothetical protein